MRKWTLEDSKELYNLAGWGDDYVHINEKGNLCIQPKSNLAQVDLKDIIDELDLRDISTPVLLRFPDILEDRMFKVSNCFKIAKEEYGFEGNNFVVFPVKVNQMKPLIEEIVNKGGQYNIGLEAGSKPELHAVLASADDPEALIICNGYKDEAFIELALLAQKMGKKIFLVVEKLNELKTIITIAKRINIKPNIGIRIKLASSGSGKWESSGGDKSKFGLSSSALLDALDILNEHEMQDCLRLIHFHIGSQITKIRMIKNALREAAQFYVHLKKMGFLVDFVDVGGGLGVDYDGTKSSRASSANYTIQEYANDVVFNIVNVSEKNNIPHPNIICESGRALAAHHSVLIVDVLETASLPVWINGIDIVGKDDDELIQEMYEIYKNLAKSRILEAWHDSLQIREEVLDRFSLGMVDLQIRAKSEKLFWAIARDIQEKAKDFKHLPDELRVLPRLLTDKYFCNFSVFQSLPDSWAIDQIFPIMPIQRLNEKPTVNATLQDITCDSDGKIDNFIGLGEKAFYLPVHPLPDEERYYLGFFLVGAYQEILGDLHNLFGDTNVVHINVNKTTAEISKIIDGESVSDVLGYVQYSPKQLVRKMERWVTVSVKSGKLSLEEGKEFLSNYRSGLYGYTYLG
jgi:arginine decarboxylase